MNPPSREECERWDQAQVAAFLCANDMQECAATVHRLSINGPRLLSLTDSEISKFSLVHQPQLQKMVQDIRKSDGSLLTKLRRLKSKPLPKVPARDYRDDQRLPGSDHRRRGYEDPQEEQDDSYEPPPSHAPLAAAHAAAAAAFPGEDYLDNRHNFPQRPAKKPVRPARNASGPPQPRASDLESDEDYIDPDDGGAEDNYVEPAESHWERGLLASLVNNEGPPGGPSDLGANTEKRPFPLPDRRCTLPQTQSHSLPPMPCPRMDTRRSQTREAEPTSDEEYEVCDPGGVGHRSAEALRRPLPPKPLPRERSPKPAVRPRPDAKYREFEHAWTPADRLPPVAVPTGPQKALSLDSKRPQILPPHFTSAPDRRGAAGSTDPDKDPEVRNKPWYAGACDRKTADEALLRSNKDGAFTVRNSSGQDAQQPYTLVVLYNGRVYNIPVRFVAAAQQYALGSEKSGEEYFSSVSHIIQNHQRTPLVVIDGQNNTKDTTRLNYPVRPQGWGAEER